MKLDNSTFGILIRTYLFGALLLIVFYAVIFYFGTSQTEDINSMKRLAIVGEYYLDKYNDAEPKSVTVDPLLTIYTDYSALPESLQTEISSEWTGSSTFHLEDLGLEYNVLAKAFVGNEDRRVLYAVEDIEAIELNEEEVVILLTTVFGGGVVLLLLASAYIVKSARQISEPMTELADQLSKDEQFEPIKVKGHLSNEMVQMEAAMNTYRTKIAAAFDREKSFTRYVSHELRTPMTVIKGSASVLSKSPDKKVLKQVGLVREAIQEMESLTQTFLFLAREQVESDKVLVDEAFLQGVLDNFKSLIDANNVEINITLLKSFELNSCHQLLSAAVGNLVHNAVNCSLEGTINVFASEREIKVIDNGVGLDAEPRSHEGFGVGLKIVNDICNKYRWQFSLANNVSAGCTASIKFI